jgi:NADPH2:quinone reductase
MMRAIRFQGWRQAPVIDELPEPVAGDGEVLVRVQAAGLSHLDLTVASGTFGFKPALPYTAGVEGSGVVVSGAGFEPGTQVLVRGGGIGLRRDGTWAAYVAAPAKAVSALSAPLEPAVAATFFQPTSTAYVALHDIARIQDAEHVIVVGAAGAVGGQVVQQALQAGARVTGVVSRTDQLARLDPVAEGLLLDDAEGSAALAKERSATLLVDTIGGALLPERIRWVAPGGRAVLVGYVAGTTFEVDLPSWLLEDVALLPMNMIRREPRARELSGVLARQLAAGRLSLDVEAFTPEQVPEALVRLASGNVAGRAALVWPRFDGANTTTGAR